FFSVLLGIQHPADAARSARGAIRIPRRSFRRWHSRFHLRAADSLHLGFPLNSFLQESSFAFFWAWEEARSLLPNSLPRLNQAITSRRPPSAVRADAYEERVGA